MLLVCIVFCIGCGNRGDSDDVASVTTLKTSVPIVVVTSYPLYAMVSEIAGDAVEVLFPAMEADVVRDWLPTAEDIRTLQSADLILTNGAGYEPWAVNLSLPRSRTIDTSAVYAESLVKLDDTVTHQHGPKGAGSDTEVAWATWLNPNLLTLQLQQATQELGELLPDKADEIRGRAATLQKRLDRMTRELEQMKQTASSRNVIADARQYGSLVAVMGWTLVPLPAVLSSDKDSRTDALLRIVKESPPDLVILSPADFATNSGSFKQARFKMVAIDLCETAVPESALMDRLEHNVQTLENAVSVE